MWDSASEGRADPRDTVLPFGREPACRHEGFSDLLATRIRYERNTKVFDEDDSADCFYRVLEGGVRMVKLTSDGRRQITNFYLSGDMFGLEAEVAHHFSAEAFDASDIMIIRRAESQARGAESPQFMLMLWEQTAAQLRRAQDHMVLLGRKNAPERVAAFLLDLADRLFNDDAIDIPMSRLDIADYLGLTIETVSRTLTQFQRDRIIFMPATRRVVIRDRSALWAMSAGEPEGPLATCVSPQPVGVRFA
jgi:CRP/FNR family transcriptional regulator, nitrogen fixation regulation protein